MKTKEIIRHAIMIVLVALTMICLFGTPSSEFYSREWLLALIGSKFLALVFAVLTHALANKWYNHL